MASVSAATPLSLRLRALRGMQRVEGLFDRAFKPALNPWRNLGALSFFLFWVVTVSGIYLYAFFDTSAAGAYRSVEELTRGQWYAGGIARSLHRYASDAFVLTTILHLIKEFLGGHYHGYRWFSWVTGVPLLWLLYASGIGGYWLVYDELAQFSLIASAEWFDWLGITSDPVMRNFLTPTSVSDRFFSLIMFLHIGIPLALLACMWVHIQRISYARTVPPRALGLAVLATLLAASTALPATSHGPANLALVPASLQLDWFYLFPHPLMYATSPAVLWVVAGGFTLALLALPLVPHVKPMPVAQVSPANCNGCGRCFADCPYDAVIMQPRGDGRAGQRLAVVSPELCASCGICAGACPSSTPFRSTEALVSGIDMPEHPINEIRGELERALSTLTGEVRIVLFGCDHGADLARFGSAHTATLSLYCAAMLPPAFIEYALRSGADGVLVTGCREGDCEYRLGQQWVEQRIGGQREPHLRINVPSDRVRIAWAGPLDEPKLAHALAAFRRDISERGKLSRLPVPARLRRTRNG